MSSTSPKRGEIWRANLEPTTGDEIGKIRPVVVISDDQVGILALRLAVPITGWNERFRAYPWMVLLEPDSNNGLIKNSAADAFQTSSLSVSRFVSKMGELSQDDINAVAEAIALVIGYSLEQDT